MIRAAAKNHGDVTVVVDPADYTELLAQLSSADGVSQDFRKKMAWKAYQHTASYDAQVGVNAFLAHQQACLVCALVPWH